MIATVWCIVPIHLTLRTIDVTLPRYSFSTLRQLHFIVRDTASLRATVELARSVPGDRDALDRLSRANGFVSFRFTRQDYSSLIPALPD